eukprot:m.883137 g.883137  ORF g.883137 m.883137 type:complete len:118 (-) comp59880_c0_seq8:737-1090(-)
MCLPSLSSLSPANRLSALFCLLFHNVCAEFYFRYFDIGFESFASSELTTLTHSSRQDMCGETTSSIRSISKRFHFPDVFRQNCSRLRGLIRSRRKCWHEEGDVLRDHLLEVALVVVP